LVLARGKVMVTSSYAKPSRLAVLIGGLLGHLFRFLGSGQVLFFEAHSRNGALMNVSPDK
jgi:hypothetical protein